LHGSSENGAVDANAVRTNPRDPGYHVEVAADAIGGRSERRGKLNPRALRQLIGSECVPDGTEILELALGVIEAREELGELGVPDRSLRTASVRSGRRSHARRDRCAGAPSAGRPTQDAVEALLCSCSCGVAHLRTVCA
jgi:hypothetical protein